MILVTLGTQDKPFDRLVEAIIDQVKKGNITERVVVQVGQTNYQSDLVEIVSLLPMDKMDQLIDEARLIITHAGVGTILNALQKNKKLIVVARRKKYKEAANDHQLQIVENFTSKGYVLGLDDFADLQQLLIEIENFEPRPYQSNNTKLVQLIKQFIDDNC